jgi:hypothetical protein
LTQPDVGWPRPRAALVALVLVALRIALAAIAGCKAGEAIDPTPLGQPLSCGA